MDSIFRRFQFHSFPSDDALARAVAGNFVDRLTIARDESRFFSIALSGGRIAAAFLGAAANLVIQRGGLGELTHFFWADERCVPPNDAESNYRLANSLLLAPLLVPPSQVHRIPGEAEPAQAASCAAAEYARVMAANGVAPPRLDLVLLGMGEDGHIASLFPREPTETTADPLSFRAVVGPKPPPNRITMGYPTLATAREVWVLAKGRIPLYFFLT
jgi:6-phosphogluconolactonase